MRSMRISDTMHHSMHHSMSSIPHQGCAAATCLKERQRTALPPFLTKQLQAHHLSPPACYPLHSTLAHHPMACDLMSCHLIQSHSFEPFPRGPVLPRRSRCRITSSHGSCTPHCPLPPAPIDSIHRFDPSIRFSDSIHAFISPRFGPIEWICST